MGKRILKEEGLETLAAQFGLKGVPLKVPRKMTPKQVDFVARMNSRERLNKGGSFKFGSPPKTSYPIEYFPSCAPC